MARSAASARAPAPPRVRSAPEPAWRWRQSPDRPPSLRDTLKRRAANVLLAPDYGRGFPRRQRHLPRLQRPVAPLPLAPHFVPPPPVRQWPRHRARSVGPDASSDPPVVPARCGDLPLWRRSAPNTRAPRHAASPRRAPGLPGGEGGEPSGQDGTLQGREHLRRHGGWVAWPRSADELSLAAQADRARITFR